MNRYQFPAPRAALGLAAVALTALTVGLWVIAPTTAQPGSPEAGSLATANAVKPEPTQAALAVACVEPMQVVGVRHPTLATTLVRHLQPVPFGPKQQI